LNTVLRLLLPPNLATAAPRDAIAVKVELDLVAAPSAELWPVLAALQRLCGSANPAPFLQLTRAQLRELVTAAGTQPVFFWVNDQKSPILWVGPILRGVSEHLQEKSQTPEPKLQPQIGREIPNLPSGSNLPAPRSSLPASCSSPLTVDGSEHFLAITLPSREHIAYASALELVKTAGFALEPSNRKWWLRDRHKALNFLAAHGDRLRNEFRAEFTPNFEKNTARLAPAEIICDAIDNGNGFNVTVALRAGKVPEDQLLSAAASNRGYVEAEGRVYLVSAAQLGQLAKAQRALAGDTGAGIATNRTHRVSTARLAEAEAIIEEIAPHFQPPAAWRERSAALRNLSKLTPAPIPAAFDAQLRVYQRLGAAWLWHLYRHQLGGILADEMAKRSRRSQCWRRCAPKTQTPKCKCQRRARRLRPTPDLQTVNR
jgi:hypothetical protein